MKPSKKQVAVTADQLGRALHYLGELNVNYALVVDTIPSIFTNSTARHGVIMLRDALEMADKIHELRMEEEAARLADLKINPDDGAAKG